MAVQGACLCGKVRYEIHGPLLNVDNCHCSMCRRQHGAAFSTYADFEPDCFKWVSGTEYVKIYKHTSDAGWCFCSECGSTLAGTKGEQVTSIALASVEGDVGVKPEFHIFVGSKAGWYEINDELPKFEQRPPDKWKP